MQFVFPQQKQVASQIHKTLQVFAESQGEIRPPSKEQSKSC